MHSLNEIARSVDWTPNLNRDEPTPGTAKFVAAEIAREREMAESRIQRELDWITGNDGSYRQTTDLNGLIEKAKIWKEAERWMGHILEAETLVEGENALFLARERYLQTVFTALETPDRFDRHSGPALAIAARLILSINWIGK